MIFNLEALWDFCTSGDFESNLEIGQIMSVTQVLLQMYHSIKMYGLVPPQLIYTKNLVY
jgi:hypothetical protein